MAIWTRDRRSVKKNGEECVYLAETFDSPTFPSSWIDEVLAKLNFAEDWKDAPELAEVVRAHIEDVQSFSGRNWEHGWGDSAVANLTYSERAICAALAKCPPPEPEDPVEALELAAEAIMSAAEAEAYLVRIPDSMCVLIGDLRKAVNAVKESRDV